MGGGPSDIFRIPLPISLNRKRYFEVYVTHTDTSRDHDLTICTYNDNENLADQIFIVYEVIIDSSGEIVESQTYINTAIGDEKSGTAKYVTDYYYSYTRKFGIQLDFKNSKAVYTNLDSNLSLTVENGYKIVKGNMHYLYFRRYGGGKSPIYVTLNFKNTKDHPFVNTNNNLGLSLFDSDYRIYEENNNGNIYAPLKE